VFVVPDIFPKPLRCSSISGRAVPTAEPAAKGRDRRYGLIGCLADVCETSGRRQVDHSLKELLAQRVFSIAAAIRR